MSSDQINAILPGHPDHRLLPAPGPAGAAPTDLGFADLIDIVNPLQHLPLVSSVYRYLTGDAIGPTARIVGDALFGGPVGLVTGVINALVEEETGSDVGGHMLAMLNNTGSSPNGTALRLASLAPRAGTASGEDGPLAAHSRAAAASYRVAGEQNRNLAIAEEIYGRTLDVGR